MICVCSQATRGISMEPEINHDAPQQAEQAPPRKPYLPPALAVYGKVSEETKIGRRKGTTMDRGSS
jgi:hypothetical protein